MSETIMAPDSLSPGQIYNSGYGELSITSKIGRGKSGYSYLARCGAEQVVLKLMHDEPCPYYHFDKPKVEMELAAYQRLTALALPVPELLSYDSQRGELIKRYIPGSVAGQVIADGLLQESVLAQLWQIGDTLRQAQLNADYFPANFVINRSKLYYIDYETNPYNSDWDLRHWGIYYWANQRGWQRYLLNGDPYALNAEPDRGQPYREPFETLVADWQRRFSCA